MTDLSDSRHSGATEIEISQEMIDAGLFAWRTWEYSDEPSPVMLVTSVYQAMRTAAACAKIDANTKAPVLMPEITLP